MERSGHDGLEAVLSSPRLGEVGLPRRATAFTPGGSRRLTDNMALKSNGAGRYAEKPMSDELHRSATKPQVMTQPRTTASDECPICGEGDSVHLFSIPDRLHQVPGSYTYVRCAGCATVRQNPRVVSDDLTLCYPGDYFTHAAEVEPTFRSSATWDRFRKIILQGNGRPGRRRVSGLLKMLPPLASRARLGLPAPIAMPSGPGDKALEVGPGRGTDLLRLKRLGWDPVGLEVDPDAAREASRLAGCPVLVGDVADLPSVTEATFGLVYLSHSFEHLPEPARALEAIHGALRPGGQVVLVFPNSRSLVCRVYGADAVSWDPPRHLTLPSAGATVTALRRIGYADVRVRSLPGRAAHYASISSAYRRGLRGQESWYQTIRASNRALAAVERVGTLLGATVGEELVVSARKPNGSD